LSDLARSIQNINGDINMKKATKNAKIALRIFRELGG